MEDIRTFLERETRALHGAVDTHAAIFDLNSRDGFESFLTFMWRGCTLVERGLSRMGAASFLEEWNERTRSEQLISELSVSPEMPQTSVEFSSEAEAWGAFYVLEGSRLGVRALSQTTDLANESAFFQEAGECRFWPEFLNLLRAADSRLGDRTGMLSGARKAFLAFAGQSGA